MTISPTEMTLTDTSVNSNGLWSVQEIAFDPRGDNKIVVHHYRGDIGLPSVYVQAGIHGNEHPGMIVTLKLIEKLKKAQKNGAQFGPITIVPFSNPFAFAQTQYGEIIGRFDIKTGDNFNRYFPEISQNVVNRCKKSHLVDLSKNDIRSFIREELDDQRYKDPCTEMKQVLFRMASEHDIVLDLHADNKSLIHFYAPNYNPQITSILAKILNSNLILTGIQEFNGALDDTLNYFWTSVISKLGIQFNSLVPTAYTLELRGRYDVNEIYTEQDSSALLQFLFDIKEIKISDQPKTKLQMFPVTGIDRGTPSILGYLKLHRQLGEQVKKGDLIAEIYSFSGPSIEKLFSKTGGILFCHSHLGVVPIGQTVYKIAGQIPLHANDSGALED